MADLMISFGVAKEDLILEDQSQNTYENAVLSKPFLTELEAKSALLVTSAFHMQRSLAVFEKAMPVVQWIPYGTDIQTVQRAPSVIEWLPTVGTLRQSQAYLRERVGIWSLWLARLSVTETHARLVLTHRDSIRHCAGGMQCGCWWSITIETIWIGWIKF